MYDEHNYSLTLTLGSFFIIPIRLHYGLNRYQRDKLYEFICCSYHKFVVFVFIGFTYKVTLIFVDDNCVEFASVTNKIHDFVYYATHEKH